MPQCIRCIFMPMKDVHQKRGLTIQARALWHCAIVPLCHKVKSRGEVLEDVLGLDDVSRTHFEVLGLGLENQVLVLGLENQVLVLGLEASSLRKLTVLGSRTALFFEQLKFCRKTPETSRKICEDLFLFSSIGDRRKKIFKTLFA